ncbi:Plasminogen activator inhibitor 1 RNA-binding protein [Halocaridina rubra]|uniref:Plasminogen activator inhibitor 1 RNA-binding protein n=1 Tax=Halocaridina rubra TaxID=373956 RepID=A0AAN8WI03_HALRR
MENSYGIGVRNRYELFYDDEADPMDLLKQTEKIKDKSSEKENKAKGTAAKKPQPPEKTTSKKVDNKAKTENKITEKANQPPTQTKGSRSNEGRVKFSDREERNNRRNRNEGGGGGGGGGTGSGTGGEFRDAPPPRFDGEVRGGMGRGRARGMGRGRGRGRGGYGGPDARGKREYDRQSGMATTGVKSIDKRDGSGSFNWGSDKDQIDEQLNSAPAANSDLDTSAENVEKPAEETVATTEEETPKEEETAKEMTLDEWKAMQGSRNKPTFNIRRAGEGENQGKWNKMYILKKKVEEESDEEEEEEEDEEEVHHGRRRVVLDIDFQFSDSPARGRGRGRGRGGPGRGRGMDRGGRGGDRMGGGRGERGDRRGGSGSRGGRGANRQEAPKMDDERDFPSLG